MHLLTTPMPPCAVPPSAVSAFAASACAQLRECWRRVQVPAGALPLNFGTMWDLISTQKDLDLPAHKVMVASVRCNQISDEHATALQSDQAWTALHTESQAGIVVTDFKSRATELISSCVYGCAPCACSLLGPCMSPAQ